MTAGAPAALTILIHGDPRLRRPARPVAPDEDLGDLPARLLAGMRDHRGIGLAAPQLGDLRRVVAVSDPESGRSLVLVNPELDETFGPPIPFEEGCLSFPGLYLTLLRPRGVAVRYREPDGGTRTLRDEGILSRVIQHELDHLDGVLFIDHLPRWRRWWLAGRLRRLRRPPEGSSA
ncbi:MAG: peptide deformylase [Candidatus Krumholzibacteriia bacterium]